ncbi:MAG: hypothetical protein KDA92_07485 [Planctomycetales bacterium]|nr:hypothetical protein [Planctomycetales bacterium]
MPAQSVCRANLLRRGSRFLFAAMVFAALLGCKSGREQRSREQRAIGRKAWLEATDGRFTGDYSHQYEHY